MEATDDELIRAVGVTNDSLDVRRPPREIGGRGGIAAACDGIMTGDADEDDEAGSDSTSRR